MGKKNSVFAKIGNGFLAAMRAIGRFIAQNAWIQPILVVALIFALIFGLTGIPKVIDCINNLGSDEETKISKVTNLKSYSALKNKMDNPTGDFIIIFGKESCSVCQSLNAQINNYQKNVGTISELYYYDITTMMENVYDEDASKHDPALDELKYITDKIVDVYLEQANLDDWSVNVEVSDKNAKWLSQDIKSLDTPTTAFYVDGKLWNVVKSTWVNGESNYSECNEFLSYWREGDLAKFNEFLGRNV